MSEYPTLSELKQQQSAIDKIAATAYQAIYRATHKVERREYAWSHRAVATVAGWRYRGVDFDERRYQKMLSEQGGVCAWCRRAPRAGGRRLVVDHDHATGKIRGLLCHNCNSSVIRDWTLDSVSKLLEYLRRGEL